jgi:hypothetical protein
MDYIVHVPQCVLSELALNKSIFLLLKHATHAERLELEQHWVDTLQPVAIFPYNIQEG